MTASQRIRHIIKIKDITIKYFCDKVGVSRNRLNQMFKNDSDPKLPLLQACLREFPELNSRWLILGEGEMWDSDKEENTNLTKEVMEMKEKLEKIYDRLENEL